MKKFSIKSILLLATILGLGACKKQLDLFPPNSIEQSQSFQSVKDATSWNNGLYSDLRGRVYGGFTIPQDVQADYLNATLDYGNRNGNPHRWGQSFLADDGALSTAWSGYYSALKNINLCIQRFPSIPTTTATEVAQLNKYTGDAYLARAYYYSELIIRFAKPYEPTTATTDLGVPLVLTYDINALPARSTVKQVYDQILADIAKAKTLITNNGSQSAATFNKDAVNALEARVRLNMQDWTGAMTAANTIITSGTYPLITSQAGLRDMWRFDKSTEVVMQVSLSRPNELGNTNSIYLGLNPANNRYTPDFVPTQTILNLYENTDRRKGVFFNNTYTVLVQGVTYSNIYLVDKFYGDSTLWTAATTNYQNRPKIFRAAEQYLIYAEAAQRAGGTNEALALTVLNQLRVARGLTALTGLTGTSLQQAIRDERTRELAFEGFRLWDLKRWHLGFTRGTPQNLNIIQQGPNFNLLTIPADDNKFTWGIPTNDISVNKNIVQNPGW